MTYFNLCLILVMTLKGSSGEKKLGLYEIDLVSSRNCNVPSNKRGPQTIPVNVETYPEGARHMARWNLTIPKLVGPMQTRVLIYILRNKVLQKAFDKTIVPCEDLVLKTLMDVAKIRLTYDCRIKKGFYYHNRFDVNELLHSVSRVLPYGTMKLRYEWSDPQGVVTCLEGDAVSRPLNVTE